MAQTAGTFEGHLVGIYIGTETPVRIAACLSQDLDINMATRNINNADSGDWDKIAPGRKNCSISGRGHFQFDAGYGVSDLVAAMENETELSILITNYNDDDAEFGGTGYVTSLKASFPDHENTEYDFTIQLNGKLVMNISDWFLPSEDELEQMYINLHSEGIGGFDDVPYSSSTEVNATQINTVNFSTGAVAAALKSLSTPNVRACRTFISRDYSVGEIGPGGGYIFYISGTTCYEAAESDISEGYAWSNITAVEIGTTGSVIGTGKANTEDIITQDGHTDSAAYLCSLYGQPE